MIQHEVMMCGLIAVIGIFCPRCAFFGIAIGLFVIYW